VKITHITNTFDRGGAEMMLHRLLSRLPRSEFSCDVVALKGPGPVGEMIAALGIDTTALDLSRARPGLGGVPSLVRHLRRARPDLVHTWMYHANLMGGTAAAMSGRIPVVWGIHHGDPKSWSIGRVNRFIAGLGGAFSSFLPRSIVCVSDTCRERHVEAGYAASKVIVIPNGIDTAVYRPDPTARIEVRRELEIPDDAVLVGVVGRFDPAKDHRGFFQAISRLHSHLPLLHLLLCGRDVTWQNGALAGWVKSAGMTQRCTLLGERDDVPRLLTALDVGCLPSRSESFGLIVGEAMSCGVPCVATDVGAARELIGDTGRIVPREEAAALADALGEIVALDRRARAELGRRARHRIESGFGLAAMVDAYATLYRGIATSRREVHA